jgi:hypothetical protein
LFETGAEKLIFPMGWEQRRQRNEEWSPLLLQSRFLRMDDESGVHMTRLISAFLWDLQCYRPWQHCFGKPGRWINPSASCSEIKWCPFHSSRSARTYQQVLLRSGHCISSCCALLQLLIRAFVGFPDVEWNDSTSICLWSTMCIPEKTDRFPLDCPLGDFGNSQLLECYTQCACWLFSIVVLPSPWAGTNGYDAPRAQ